MWLRAPREVFNGDFLLLGNGWKACPRYVAADAAGDDVLSCAKPAGKPARQRRPSDTFSHLARGRIAGQASCAVLRRRRRARLGGDGQPEPERRQVAHPERAGQRQDRLQGADKGAAVAPCCPRRRMEPFSALRSKARERQATMITLRNGGKVAGNREPGHAGFCRVAGACRFQHDSLSACLLLGPLRLVVIFPGLLDNPGQLVPEVGPQDSRALRPRRSQVRPVSVSPPTASSQRLKRIGPEMNTRVMSGSSP